MLYILYAFFWVIPRRLNFICRRFGTFCLFHLHRRIGVEWLCLRSLSTPIRLWSWNRKSVPKRRHIKFRRRGITQKKAYNRKKIVEILCFSLGWLHWHCLLQDGWRCPGRHHSFCCCYVTARRPQSTRTHPKVSISPGGQPTLRIAIRPSRRNIL